MARKNLLSPRKKFTITKKKFTITMKENISKKLRKLAVDHTQVQTE